MDQFWLSRRDNRNNYSWFVWMCLSYKYRLTWTRSGTREYAPNYVTVTCGTTSVTATTTDTDYVYRLATSIPLTPTGGTTTEWAYSQRDRREHNPLPPGTQGVYRAQRTRTNTQWYVVSATEPLGGVFRLLDPSGLAVSFDITVSTALGTVRGNDNSIVYVATFSSTDAGNTIVASDYGRWEPSPGLVGQGMALLGLLLT